MEVNVNLFSDEKANEINQAMVNDEKRRAAEQAIGMVTVIVDARGCRGLPDDRAQLALTVEEPPRVQPAATRPGLSVVR
jgi:hypothetical protein